MIAIVVAESLNRVISRDGQIPWRLATDLKRFRERTLGHTVIMGRKTFESLPERYRPLPGRRNIVLSRNGFQHEGVIVCQSWEETRAKLPHSEESFVIGGEQIYQLALPSAILVYRTLVLSIIPGDAFFPPFGIPSWQLIKNELHRSDAKNDYPFLLQTWARA